MIKCPNCNKELDDSSKFCDSCGTALELPKAESAEAPEAVEQAENIFCPSCGNKATTDMKHCPNCGASLSPEAIAPQPIEEVKSSPFAKLPKKLIAAGAGVIALILVAVIIITSVFSGPKNNFALYLKDNQMQLAKVSNRKPWQVTENFSNNTRDYGYSEYGYRYGNYTYITADGKMIFYVDKLSDGDKTLYYRYINSKKEPVRIDKNVERYAVSESGKLLVYQDDAYNLYSYNLEEKTKIDKNVRGFFVSKDCKNVIYKTDNGDLYFAKTGSDKKEKLESGIGQIEYVNKSFDTVYYLKDGAFYKKVLGKDKEKIESDISRIIKIYDSGEIYYTKSKSSSTKLADFVEDDMAMADASITEPESPEYPYSSDFDTTEEYDKAYDAYRKASDEYSDLYQAYSDKLKRDSLRERLAEETIGYSTYELYYFNGKVKKVIADNYDGGDYSERNYAEDRAVIAYCTVANYDSVPKIRISEIDSIYEVDDMVREKIDENDSKAFVAIKDTVTAITPGDGVTFTIDKAGNSLYFKNGVSEGCGTLYKVDISGSKPKKAERYDTDVYAFRVAEDGAITYYKDYDNSGDLYINKKLISSDANNYTYYPDTKTVLFYTDWNSSHDEGTLMIYNGKKAKKIAEYVTDEVLTPNGEVLYLNDYSNNSYSGTLRIYNGKSKIIEEDVVCIIPVLDAENQYRYNNNY